jgi:hypothetical protein
MKIGILEIVPWGHITLIDSLSSIYCSNDKNQVFIFVLPELAEHINYLSDRYSNLTIVLKQKDQSLEEFLVKTNDYNVERLYVCTLDKYFLTFYKSRINTKIHLVIHNVDLWFTKSVFNLAGIRKVLNKHFIYWFKVYYIYPFIKRLIIAKVIKGDGKIVVLSDNIKLYLSSFIDPELIETIPFSIRKFENLTDPYIRQRLRICIPGMVSKSRRNYDAFFDLIEQDIDFYKNNIEIDLLGKVAEYEDGRKIIDRALILRSKGINIDFYSSSLIPMDEYDELLNKSDVILGIINVGTGDSMIYGKTKETGTVFAMIRTSKPGILPVNYKVIDEFKDAVMYYSTYTELDNILKNLISDRSVLKKLVERANNAALNFEPSTVLNKLL